VDWYNSGGSQAVEVRADADTGVCDDPRDKSCVKMRNLSPGSDDKEGGVTRERGGAFFTLKLLPQTPDIIEAIETGKKFIYLYGIITYRDIFGTDQWVKFCYFYSPRHDNYPQCLTHNDVSYQQYIK
jgi:hypothetical protein